MGRVLRRLSEDDVVTQVHGICFKTGPPTLVGVEAEWLVNDTTNPRSTVPLTRLTAAADAGGPLPSGGAISYEPGGQLEISSLPCPGPLATYRALHADLAHIRASLAGDGLRLVGRGVEPYRSPRRQLRHPRYRAMEAYFDSHGPYGRVMMCSTAAVQVCVDIGGDPHDAARRWRLANALGPTLVAAFANSPLREGRVTGWKSTRQAVWSALDPSRTGVPRGADPVEAWTRYALDAQVMVIRHPGRAWTANPGCTFREWLREGGDGRPNADDLSYHLTTLFPPVRPQGWLELRMIDAQPGDDWAVPLAVVAALFDDPAAADCALSATEPVADRWLPAARDGLGDPALARAAAACFQAALAALRRTGAAELIPPVERFAERYVRRRRCPADDLLDAVASGAERSEPEEAVS